MADDLKEIVTVEQIDRLFLLLAVGGPFIGAAVGALVGKKSGTSAKSIKLGIIIGMLGPANLVLWNIYNAVTRKLGLDTVKNLLVNLGLFITIGIVAGLTIAYVNRKSELEMGAGTTVSAGTSDGT